MPRKSPTTLTFFLLVFSLAIFIGPGSLFGQAELTQTYTSPDGKFSIRYPEGWFATEQGSATALGNSEALKTRRNLSPGQAALVMQFVAVGSAKLTLSDAVKLFAGADGFSDPAEAVIAGFPALQVRGPGQPLGFEADVVVTVVDVGGGTLGVIVGAAATGELGNFEPIFMTMLETLTYNEAASPPAVENTLGDLKPITPANAAQIVEVAMLRGHAGQITNVAFSHDGATLFSSSADKSLWLWDLAGSEIVGQPHEQQVFGIGGSNIAVSPDGTLLASDDVAGELVLRDAATGEVLRTLTSNGLIAGIAFGPDGTTMASYGRSSEVLLWDVTSGSALRQISAGTPTSIAFSPDGITLAVGQLNSGDILLVNAETGQTIATFSGHQDTVSALAFSPDGKYLASGGAFGDKTVQLWDVATGQSAATFGGFNNRVTGLAFSPDGAILGAAAQPFKLLDVEAQKELELTALLASNSGSLSSASSVAFNPDGTVLALGGGDGMVRLLGTSVAAEGG